MHESEYLTGQDELRACLDKVFNKSSGHAFVFVGPDGIGKHSFAIEFAKGVLCDKEYIFGGCGICPSCKYMSIGSHPDYREVVLQENDKTIKTDAVRSMFCSDIVLLPQISDKKVYFLDGDFLNEQSQNAILKTTEEIPEYAVLIVAVSTLQTLLPTLISRMVPINFKRYSHDEMIRIIEKKGINPNEAAFYSGLSEGIPGLALKMSENEILPEAREFITTMLFDIANIKKSDLLTEYYQFFESNKEYMEDFFMLINSWLRDATVFLSLQKDDKSVKLINQEKEDLFREKFKYETISKKSIRNAFSAVAKAAKGLEMNAGFENCICNMLIQIRKELSNA